MDRKTRSAILINDTLRINDDENWWNAWQEFLDDVERFTHQPRITEINTDNLSDFLDKAWTDPTTPAAYAAQYDCDEEGHWRSMTTAECAYDLEISEADVRTLLRTKVLKGRKIGSHWQVEADALIRYAHSIASIQATTRNR